MRESNRPESAGSRSAQLQSISKSTSQIVKDAAALLDEEVAAGIVAARQVQQRFQKERRIAPVDFQEALKKFQSDAHEVISLLNNQMDELRSQENVELVKRLITRSHDVVDLAVELVNTGAEVANQLVELAPRKHNARNAGTEAKRNARRKR